MGRKKGSTSSEPASHQREDPLVDIYLEKVCVPFAYNNDESKVYAGRQKILERVKKSTPKAFRFNGWNRTELLLRLGWMFRKGTLKDVLQGHIKDGTLDKIAMGKEELQRFVDETNERFNSEKMEEGVELDGEIGEGTEWETEGEGEGASMLDDDGNPLSPEDEAKVCEKFERENLQIEVDRIEGVEEMKLADVPIEVLPSTPDPVGQPDYRFGFFSSSGTPNPVIEAAPTTTTTHTDMFDEMQGLCSIPPKSQNAETEQAAATEPSLYVGPVRDIVKEIANVKPAQKQTPSPKRANGVKVAAPPPPPYPSLPAIDTTYANPPLPYEMQHRILTPIQSILEHTCFAFLATKAPHVLERNGWTCAEAGELSAYVKEIVLGSTTSTFFAGAGASASTIFSSLAQVRHKAVHREKITLERLRKLLEDSQEAAAILGDGLAAKKIGLMAANIQQREKDFEQERKRLKKRMEPQLHALREEIRRVEYQAEQGMQRAESGMLKVLEANVKNARLAQVNRRPTWTWTWGVRNTWMRLEDEVRWAQRGLWLLSRMRRAK